MLDKIIEKINYSPNCYGSQIWRRFLLERNFWQVKDVGQSIYGDLNF